MLGDTRKPILPHPRSAQYGRAREKHIPISDLVFLRYWFAERGEEPPRVARNPALP